MGSLKRRLLITMVVTAIAAAMGGLAGYRLARTITARMTAAALDRYARQILADSEASTAELRTLLTAVGASHYDSCSGEEAAYFRALIFESDFVRDAGRMRDGKIACSATLGGGAMHFESAKPDFTQQDGTLIYKNLAPYRNRDLTAIAIQRGTSFVVFTPDTRLHLEPLPMHYAETLMDAPTQKFGALMGELPRTGRPAYSADGLARVGDNLSATHCSIRFFNCVTAYTSMAEMVAANRTKFSGCIWLSALLGAFSGLAGSLLYRRNKGLEQQLRRAIRRDEVWLAYQPIVKLPSGRIVGAEALARWTDEEGRSVGPDVFVRIAEERGFVGAITRLVVRHALRDFGETLRGDSNFRLSINVTASDLADPGFRVMLDEALHEAGVSAHRLAIEITESSTVQQAMAMDTIQHLREQGHSVHIDDFGTGYSSLSYLQDLSVDVIKIDRSFTQAIGTGSVVVAIVPQIMAMAKALKLGVIVEGIETPPQAAYFSGLAQPVLGQGWLFGRPISAADFHSLLDREYGNEAERQGSNLLKDPDLELAPADAN